MAILLKTTSVRVSSIQIMQVRVKNKGKSVWKSRYDGDVSPTKKRRKKQTKKTKKMREKERSDNVTILYHTCASK